MQNNQNNLRAGDKPDTFAGATPAWHNVWTPLTEEASRDWRKAMQIGGLDWEPLVQPFPNPYTGKPTEEIGVFRSDNHDCIGAVKGRYTPVSNAEAFQFLEDLAEASGDFIVDSCGSFKGGSFVFANTRVLNTEFEVVKNDIVVPYFRFMNSFNGATKFITSIGLVRTVCGNTWNYALHEAQASGDILSFRHTKNGVGQLTSAKEWLNMMGQQTKTLQEKMRFLAQKRMTADMAIEATQALLNFKEKDKEIKYKKDSDEIKGNRKTSLLKLILDAEGASGVSTIQGTVWEWFNKVTFAYDHLLENSAHTKEGKTKKESHVESVTFGAMAKKKEGAFEIAMQFAQKA